MQKLTLHFWVAMLLIVVAASTRLLPHIFNLAPISAMALFGMAHLRSKWLAVLMPLAAMWLSDLYLNNVVYKEYFPVFTWFYRGAVWQYLSFVAVSALSLLLLRNRVTVQRVFIGALTASVLFFLISNFGVWVSGSIYPHNASGLLACYAAGLPFFKGTLMGDLIYSSVLFGSMALFQHWVPQLRAEAV